MRAASILLWVAVIALLAQALTSLGGEVLGWELRGWPLLIHLGVGPAFAVSLPVWAMMMAGRRSFQNPALAARVRDLAFWVTVAGSGLITLSMLAVMLPLVGHDEQHELVELHELGGFVVLGGLAVYLLAGRLARVVERPALPTR